ncbi:MAG: amidohydrolase family protein [Nitrospinae bacterium]|nr:amidohydrolase family protein [Nitrospinota bacterium]
MWLSKKDLKKLENAEAAAFRSPVPTQMVSNGEYMPLAQTKQQREVEARIKTKAEALGKKFGMGRRRFLQTSCGMAAAFIAMNEVYGPFFHIDPVEAADPAAARERAKGMAREFIFDDQTHHVRSSYTWDRILFLTKFAQGHNPQQKTWNPKLGTQPPSLEQLKFDAYVKDIFLDSDTTIAVLSGFTSEAKENEALTSDEIVQSRNLINRLAGSRRVLAHGLFWPGYPGNLEEMDRAATQLRVDSWKGYTVGDPLAYSQYAWRMDDEKVAYPAWAKAEKYGIRNICIHKGLLPADYKTFKNWEFANVDDLGKAAKDWPQLNFIIYHAALRPLLDATTGAEEFKKTGRIPWITDLAEIPEKYGVKNVYAEVGTTFASTVITFPELAAAILGQLIKGMGTDHVVWGTDSIWYGSPQWQIEAFRRFEIPQEMRKKYGFAPLGPATGRVKRLIFGLNSAKLYNIDPAAKRNPVPQDFKDKLAKMKAEYQEEGPKPSHMYYGWIRKRA